MKDTLKTLELLEQHIDRVVENGLYEIERDLLLERLRGIYATVVATEAIAEEERVLDALIGIGATTPLLAEEEPEIEIERIYAEEEECEVQNEEMEIVAPEPETEPETEPEIAVESEPVVAEEEPTAEPEEEEPSTEDEELTVVYKEDEPADDEELDHEAVMALYDDDDESDDEEQPAEEEEVIPAAIEEDVAKEEEPESISEPEPTDEEPAEEAVEEDIEEEPALEEVQTVVLGDILASEQTTIADNLAEQMVADVASAAGANASLRSSIALNDKFILMRDLFAGNNDYYEMAIERLDSFDNLEEAMLYIHDTFHWNPNSEGARLLMELLARKLF